MPFFTSQMPPHHQLSHRTEAVARPINSNRKCVSKEGLSKCEYRREKAVSPLCFPQQPPDYSEHFSKAFRLKILKYPLLYGVFILVQGEREAKNPLLNF